MDYQPEILFDLARCGIEINLHSMPRPLPVLDPKYLEKRACFVTINLQNKLRGCIGSLVPYQSLKKDVLSNAHSAAFKDHRFTPLTEHEYHHIKLGISILSLPEPIVFENRDELESIVEPGLDGIVFTCRGKRATFLPQVWDQLPEFTTFFSQLSQKAGLGPIPDFENASIQRYRVDKYEE